MTSRLDRLFLLLETGSTSVTRKAAALQLGEVQRLHPHELHNLISKVRQYLHSNSWDTRIAAAQAVEAIVNNVPLWAPSGIKSEITSETQTSAAVIGRMSFGQFDINTVIKCGHNLLASEGTEFDESQESSNGSVNDVTDFKDKFAKQRQQLNQRLGLDMAEKLGINIDSHDIVSNDDLAHEIEDNKSAINVPKGPELDEILTKATGRSLKRKSVFSSNRLKKDIERKGSGDTDVGMSSSDNKKVKLIDDNSNMSDDLTVDINSDDWPLESFSDELMGDLFSPIWEVRHGAATALREIIKLHGTCGGRVRNAPSDQMDTLNQLWLEDVALRLLCVLALDKFGDYISDQVVAPVRETCAQTLGLILNILTPDGVNSVLKILLQLLSRPEWEARHGGFLGIKYLLAIRHDLTHQLMPIVYQPIFGGLKDSVDDVSAVAAAALVPVKDVLIETMPEKIPIVIDYLWDSLLDLDDLSSSTGDLLMLLSSLLTFNADTDSSALITLVPRLWPFLCHSLSSVRKSVLESLLILSRKDPSVWLTIPLLSDALRLLFQRCLLENKNDILQILYNVWYQFVTKASLDNLLMASCQYLSGWICIMMHPSRIAIDADTCVTWFEMKNMHQHALDNHNRGRSNTKYDHQNSSEREQYYIGGSESLSESPEQREKCVTRARLQSAKLIGLLACFVSKHRTQDTGDSPSPIECFANILLFHLNSKSATQRMCIAWIINEWAKASIALNPKCELKLLPIISNKCLECIQEIIYFDEISTSFTRLQHETREIVSLLKQNKFPIDENTYQTGAIYTFDQISALSTIVATKVPSKIKPKILESIEAKIKSLLKSLNDLSRCQTSLSTSVLSAIAGAIVSWGDMPEKLNPIVRPLMDSIKSEENEQLQMESSINLVLLLVKCCDRPSNMPSPVPKIVKNLITYLCSDQNFTPIIADKFPSLNPQTSASSVTGVNDGSGSSSPVTPPVNQNVILTLDLMLKSANKAATMRRSNSLNTNKKGKSDITNAVVDDTIASNTSESDDRQNEILRRGASHALAHAAKHFGSELPIKLPYLWEQITYVMIKCENKSENKQLIENENAQNLIYSLQVLEIIGLHLHPDLHKQLIQLLPYICSCLESDYPQVRHMASRCFGMLSKVIQKETIEIVMTQVLELMEASDCDIKRQGSVEAISCIIDKMALDIVPYIVLLIVPMLGRMSDQNNHVRLLATHCFAQLVQLMPLDNGNNSMMKINIDPKLIKRKETERHFLEQLMDSKRVDNYELPIPVKAELRTYQHEGVNWLAFLNKYKLHGIVADEMGLGKTLQAICILASDHFYRAEKYKESKSVDSKPLPSIAICPPTLTGHWVYEVQKFVSHEYINPLHYTGPPNERAKLKNKIKRSSAKDTYNLVIASYDIVRNDIEFFSSIKWNYCILDEGHVIKNGKTKLAKAIKSLSANHRLILTGTPIQNNVLELWSLFDFLMPGFLGTERQFMARYSRPILQSRDAKSSSKEQEAGVLAMESLHRQVLPFVLRRMKEDVLKDLPPKIMQDYYCELSPLQAQLYEDFAKSRARQNLENTIGISSSEKSEESQKSISSSHIFQALQYLRKVCNHPKLVLGPQHPQYESILEHIQRQNSSLSDINHAAKLCALRQLLLDCGIGTQSTSMINASEPVVNQHRALIFCQLKSMLDIVEHDLLKSHMPSVTYLRLDGSIPPGSRHSVVHRFNNDPSIDVLLLTTQVGGLGLNLTGADTVIFVEHDWNPMKDLQAMDRAHRIGQKKVVNVYRLITTGTLEEKIMGLQKFKLTIANTVISNENSSLQTMATDQLLDLFTLEGAQMDHLKNNASSSKSGTGMKTVLENLPDLWDADQYENEYDLTNFIQSLKT